jgi:hypothetical protein
MNLDGLRGYKLTPAHNLLIPDSFNGHLSSAFKQPAMQEKIPIAVIPGGFTKDFQPLDLAVNRLFKSHFRRIWARWIEGQALPCTNSGRIKGDRYPRSDKTCKGCAGECSDNVL